MLYAAAASQCSSHASAIWKLKKQRAKSHGSQAFTPDQVKCIFD
ncbi:hypothetical protein [Xanthomonas translucens]|nr:hypothetical protein [Xanthomonas translucens]